VKIYFITAFPATIQAVLTESMFRKAAEQNLVEYQVWDLRDFTTDKHRQIDDTPFGGSPGMVLKPEPFFRAYDRLVKLITPGAYEIIYPTPQGKILDHQLTVELTRYQDLIFFCGHYKGIDERVVENIVTSEISIGDYVLTGGELPALVIADAVIRHIPGVLNCYESAESDSFADNLLEGPIYTKPRVFRNLAVPEILVSGNHAKINQWRYEQRLKRTRERRKELLDPRPGKDDIGGKNG
jgi:tRNA (guanine37-N1)-methyltransferase